MCFYSLQDNNYRIDDVTSICVLPGEDLWWTNTELIISSGAIYYLPSIWMGLLKSFALFQPKSKASSINSLRMANMHSLSLPGDAFLSINSQIATSSSCVRSVYLSKIQLCFFLTWKWGQSMTVFTTSISVPTVP